MGPDDYREAARIISVRSELRPRVQLILGSGLADLTAMVEEPVAIPFTELPGFPAVGVSGHSGRFIVGRLAGVDVLVQGGRFHYYEGHGAGIVEAPVRIGAALGVRTLVLTNAAGGIREDLAPGRIMLIDDHMALQFRSPLAGPVVDGDARWPDMSAPYDKGLQEIALEEARRLGVPLVRGTYASVLGPAYETAAEVRALKVAGADAVGMSTVPEAIVARAQGQRVLAFSMITNRATGKGGVDLHHDEVIEVGREAGRTLGTVLQCVLPRL